VKNFQKIKTQHQFLQLQKVLLMMTKGDSLQRKFFLSYLFPPCVAVIAVAIGKVSPII